MKNNIYEALFYTIVCVLVLLQSFFLYDIELSVLKYECLFFDVLAIILAYRKLKDCFHPYIVFLLIMNVILCSRIWIEDYIDYPFAWTTFLSSYKFSGVVQCDILYMLIISFVGCSFGMYFASAQKCVRNVCESDALKSVRILSSRIMMILLPFVIYNSYKTWEIFSEYGYLALYSAQAGIVFEPPFKHIVVIFQCVFFIYLASKPDVKDLKKYSLLFFIVSAFGLFFGSRGGLTLVLLSFLTYINLYYVKFNKKKIFVGGVIFVFLMQLVAINRSLDQDESFSIADMNMSSSELLVEFFRQQGVSITVLGYADEMDDGSIYDVIYPITELFMGYLDDEYGLKNKVKYSFPHKITYTVNPNMYYKGFGAGSSYIAETYSFGGVVLLLFVNIILGYFIVYSVRKYKDEFYGRFFLLIFWQQLYFMPRGSLFGFVPIMIKWGVLCYILKKMSVYLEVKNEK